MQLRLSVPLSLILTGKEQGELFPALTFRRNGATISLKLLGNEPSHVEGSDEPHFRKVDGYELLIEIPPKVTAQYTRFIQSCAYQDLVRKLVPIVNRVNRALRNFGWISNVQEVSREAVDASLLSKWKAKWLNDVGEWKDIFEPGQFGVAGLLHFFMHLPRTDERQLSVARWPDIAEAIQQDHPPKPEDEFITNALEHLHEGNLRVAIVEAFVCLEIVLAQFLAAHFGVRRGFNDDKLARLRNASLQTKVGIILEQIFSPRDRKQANLDSVLQAYAWRNDVVHKNGHLPSTVAHDRIRDGIFETLKLAHHLSFQRDEILIVPEAQQLGREVSDRFELPYPKVQLLHRHLVHIEFDYPATTLSFAEALGETLPSRPIRRDQDTFDKAVQWLSDACAKRDRLFRAESHLSILFKQGNSLVAKYLHGKWEQRLSSEVGKPKGAV